MTNPESEFLEGEELYSFLNSTWENEKDLLSRLDGYAAYRLSQIKNDPTKKKPSDLVQELITKFYFGERKIKRNEVGKIKEVLFGALKSHISNYLNSKAFKESNHTLGIGEIELIENGKSSVETFEQNHDHDLHKELLLKKLRELSATKIEENICECWIDELLKPADICDLLCIESKDYNNARKRLLTKLRKISS